MSARTSPATVQQIVVLREAGWTHASISEKTSTSISTIQRILKRRKIKVGSAESEMIASARAELFDKLVDDELIRETYAWMAADNESQFKLARLKSAQALEEIKVESNDDAVKAMRAIAAHATTMKIHSDCVRAFTPLPESEQHLPSLTIHYMTEDEEKTIREEQRLEDQRLAEAFEDAETVH